MFLLQKYLNKNYIFIYIFIYILLYLIYNIVPYTVILYKDLIYFIEYKRVYCIYFNFNQNL